MKTKDNKCDKGWHDGSCCCNCKHQIELYKHPWNKVNKGSVTEKQHGFCEMHEPK